MYIQLIDKHNFKSPLLYIHADEEEFMNQVGVWKEELLGFIKANPKVDGLPLGRLEAATCMVDLVRHITQYYVDSTDFSFVGSGHIYGTLRLLNEDYLGEHFDGEIVEIKTYE